MLFKLMKRDFISTGRILGIVYAIAVGLSAILLISNNVKKGEDLGIVEALGIMVLALIAIGLFVLTTVVIFVDFHKTLYGEQGYLSFTLPVKGWEIILSKTLVSVIWYFFALASLLLSLFVIVETAKNAIGDEYVTLKDMLSELLSIDFGAVAFSVVGNIIYNFIRIAFFTLVIFFTNTLANTRPFQKRGILWTIVLFIPISVIVFNVADFIKSRLIFSLFFVNGSLQLVTSNSTYYDLSLNNYAGIDIGDIFVYLIFGAGIFVATHYIMSKKVNIR